MQTTMHPSGRSDSHTTDILLIGLGSIGTIYAYLLEKSGRARVTAVARSNYGLYAEKGVRIDSDRFGVVDNWKPSRVFKSQEEALADGTHYQFCVLCTKCLPDVRGNAETLEPTIKSGQVGAYLLIQNGLGVEADLSATIKGVPLLSCLAWISAVTNPSGDVVTWRGVEKLGIGIYPPPSSSQPLCSRTEAALDMWVSLIKAGEGNVVTTDDVVSMRYAKNVWTATQATLQGLTRTPQPCFAHLDESSAQLIKAFMLEVVDLGYKTGLLWEGMTVQPIGSKAGHPQSLVDGMWEKFVSKPNPAKTHKWSMLVDIEQGRPFEVEVVIGSVVKMADKEGFPVPNTRFAYALMKGMQQGILNKIQF